MPCNDQDLRRAIQKVMDLPAERLGVFGLAFKENTDDLRESPVVSLLEHLIGKDVKFASTTRTSVWKRFTAAIRDSCRPLFRTSPTCWNPVWRRCLEWVLL